MCECLSGYEGKDCVDSDECSNEGHKCSKNEVCENTEGSYTCEDRSFITQLAYYSRCTVVVRFSEMYIGLPSIVSGL